MRNNFRNAVHKALKIELNVLFYIFTLHLGSLNFVLFCSLSYISVIEMYCHSLKRLTRSCLKYGFDYVLNVFYVIVKPPATKCISQSNRGSVWVISEVYSMRFRLYETFQRFYPM